MVTLGLAVLVILLGAMVPLVSMVQGIGRERQIHLLKTLESYPVAQSQYYQIACNYFGGMEPFRLNKRYALPVLALFLVTTVCAGLTYFGAQWTNYLSTPNYVLGGGFILDLDPVTDAAKIRTYQSGTVAAGSAAFIGAYVYIIRVLLDRINNDDLFPITYYYFAVRILISCLIAGVVRQSISVFWPSDSNTQLFLLVPLGFVIGLQPDLWMVALVSKVTKYFGLVEMQKDPDAANIPGRLPLSLIEGLTDPKKTRLEELDLDNCQALAGHPFLIWARTSYQLLQIVDWMAQAQLVTMVKDGGVQKLRLLGIRDVFGLATALRGDSKGQVANTLSISPEVASDMLKYLDACPAFMRLNDVYCSLSKDPSKPAQLPAPALPGIPPAVAGQDAPKQKLGRSKPEMGGDGAAAVSVQPGKDNASIRAAG
jgi:hypothetical protein